VIQESGIKPALASTAFLPFYTAHIRRDMSKESGKKAVDAKAGLSPLLQVV